MKLRLPFVRSPVSDSLPPYGARMSPLPFARFSTATRLCPTAQGWPLWLPWDLIAKELFNRKAVASFPRRIKIGATALRLEFYETRAQGSRSGNPGLKVTTALRFAAALRRFWAFFNRL